jgi:hypothetical protein
MRTTILAVAACAVCLRISAQVETYETGTWAAIRVAAQETNGPIHAAGSGEAWGQWNLNENWRPGDNSPWNGWGSDDTARGVPFSMETAGDGSVISIWTNRSDGKVFILTQRGNIGVQGSVSGIAGPVALVRVLVDSQSNLWVTEAGVNIYKVPPRQNRTLVHVITPDELWPGGSATNRLPVSMAEDARGRIWFWSSCLTGDSLPGAIHGVLIHENGAITSHPELEGLPSCRISVIAPLEGGVLWLAVRYEGIFSVNLDTLARTRIGEPETNAFSTVQNIFSIGEDRYVLSGSQAEYNRDGLTGALWRQRGEQWTKVIDGLDHGASASPEQLANRHWSVTAEGLWLGSFGMGGWFVPRDDGPAQTINWQKNSPFDSINRWFQLKGGQMMGLQFGRGALVADAALLTQPPVRPASARILRTGGPLLQTGNGRVFGFLTGRRSVFCEWVGPGWLEFPWPDDFQPDAYETILDSLNRIWWVHLPYSTPDSTPCFIFDPARGRFERYSSYPSALQAQLPRLPGLRVGANEYFAPKFSADGRICFEDKFLKLYYFNGRVWHEWEKGKISNPQLWYQAVVNPFFATDGSLAVTLNNVTWSFSELDGWRTNAVVRPAEESKIVPAKSSFPPMPPVGANIESAVTDRMGISWLTSGGQLYCSAFGLTRACFAANEPEPFADGRKLMDVLVDNSGNAFLHTILPRSSEYVLVPARGPLPHATVKLLENGEEGVTLQLAANIDSPLFSWQMDDAPWTRAATNRTLRFNGLSAGPHRARAVALNEHLQADPEAAEITFEVSSAPPGQIQQWMAQLGDPDYARREAAVRGLARQAKLALPALREARGSESDPDRRWWLDAAIEECEH